MVTKGSRGGGNNRSVEVWVLGDSKSAQKAFSDFDKAAGKTETKLERTARRVESAGAVLGKIGVPIAVGAGLAVKAAVDFETSFAGMRKTIDASEAEFEAFAAANRQMAKEIPLSVNEINAIGEAAGQLGIQKDNIQAFTRTMADLGVATNLTSEEAATAFARFANITQMPQDQFDRLGSTVVALGNNLATTESEIAEFGLRLAGAGAQAGLSEAEILGLGAALSSVGINAEAGGTAVSKVLIDISKAVSKGGEELESFAATAGMSADEFATAFREDPAAALVAFIEGLGQVEAKGGDLFATLEELGIKEQRMRDAMLRTAGAGDLVARSMGIANDAFGENNALTNEAEQRYETMASQLEIAKNTVIDAGISIGQVFAPMVVQGAQAVGALASAFAALPTPVSSTIIGLGLIAAASKPVLSVTSKMLLGWQKLQGAFAATKTLKVAGTGIEAIGATAVNSSRSLAALSAIFSPTGALVVGAAAFAGAAYLVKRNVDQMKAANDSAAEAAPKLAEALGLAYEEISAAAGEAGDAAADTEHAFAQANANAIRQLRELQSETERGDFLLQVGWELTQHGATPEEAFDAIQKLADAAGITIPITLGDISDTERQLEAIAGTAERVAREIEANFWGMGTATKETINSIGEAAANSWKLDNVEQAITTLHTFEEAVRGTELSVLEQNQVIDQMVDHFLEMTGVQGLSKDQAFDLAGALRELTSDVVALDSGMKAQARAYLEAIEAGKSHEDALRAGERAAEEAAEAARENAEATGEAGDAADGAVGPTDEFTAAQEEAEEQLDETKTAADRLRESILALSGVSIDAAKAEIGFLDSVEQLTDAIEENGNSLDRNSEKGRLNESRFIAAAEAAIAHGEAVADDTGDVEAGAEALAAHIEQLRQEAIEAGLSEEAVAALIAELGLMPDEIRTRVEVDVTKGMSQAQLLKRELDKLPRSIVTTHHIARVGGALDGGVLQHDGGPAGRGPRHQGPLKPDEFPAVLQDGEYVVRASAAQRHGALLEMINAGVFHAGGPVLAGAAGGAADRLTASGGYNVPALMAITRQSSFGSASGHAESIEELQAAYEAVTAAIERQEEASRRAELVEKRRLAETAEERQRAAEALAEFDRDARLAAQRRRIEERVAAAEANQRIKANLEEWAFEQKSAADQLEIIRRRIAAERAGTDEWMRLKRQEQQLAEQIATDERRRVEELQAAVQERALATAEAEQRLGQQMAQQAAQHQQAVVEAHRRATEQIQQTVEARKQALTASLTDVPGDGPWGTDASTLAGNIRAQIDALTEWSTELDRLKARGLNQGVVDALGLGDSPEALNQVKVLLAATDAELDQLNAAFLDRTKAIHQRIGAEQLQSETTLASDLTTIRRDLHLQVQQLERENAARVEEIRRAHLERVAAIEQEWLEAQQAYTEQLAAAGQRQGAALGQGMADALLGAVPQVTAARAALDAAAGGSPLVVDAGGGASAASAVGTNQVLSVLNAILAELRRHKGVYIDGQRAGDIFAAGSMSLARGL